MVRLYIILKLISCFMFFANDIICYLFCMYLDYGNDARQKANLSDFLIGVQNGL